MTTYKPVPFQVDNSLDEFGRLLGIQRFPLESNVTYKRRLLNASRFWGASTKQGLINALSSEFGTRIYSVESKAYYFLSKQPILKDLSGASLGFSVYVDNVQYSDYDITGSMTTSYKLWKLGDGTPTRILEFKDVPLTGAIIRIEYYFLSDGIATLWRDIGSDENAQFLGMKEETPTSSDIEVYELHDSAFQNRYLIGSDGLPNAAYEAIVDELHRAYPVLWGEWRWGKAYWDVLDENITQIDHLPNRYDLPISGIMAADYEAGVGDGSDCSIVDIVTDSRGSIRPIIAPGYLYIDGEEYYLYGRKCIAGSGDYFATTSPVISTLATDSDLLCDILSSPFARTWYKGSRTIFRRTVRLSGTNDVYDDQIWSQVSDPWVYISMSGVMFASGTYVNQNFVTQYDAGGNYLCPIEVNPLFSPVYANKLLGIQKRPSVTNWASYPRTMRLRMFNIDGYIKRVTSATYDSLGGGGFFPDFDLNVRAEAVDENGVPLKGWDLNNTTLNVRLRAYYAGTLLDNTTFMPGSDGSIVNNYPTYSNRSVTDPKGLIISGTLNNNTTDITSTTNVLVLPLGIAK